MQNVNDIFFYNLFINIYLRSINEISIICEKEVRTVDSGVLEANKKGVIARGEKSQLGIWILMLLCILRTFYGLFYFNWDVTESMIIQM